MQTYQEFIEAALVNVQMLGTHGVFTNDVKLAIVSKAVHLYQKKTGAVKRQIGIATSSLDSEGSVTINADIAKIIRCELVTTSAISPTLVSLVADDYFTQIKRDRQNNAVRIAGMPTERYMVTRMREKIYFYPFSGVSGTVYLHYLPKLMPYSPDRGDLSTGDWADANDDLAAFMAENSPPAELDAAEDAIIAFTSAQLLKSIKNWRKEFNHDYQEWMDEFNSAIDDVTSDHNYHNLHSSAPVNGGPGS